MAAISVIMVSYHTGPCLHEAIKAVLADPDIAELILIDNGNSPAARAAYFELIKNQPRVRIAQGHSNIGFGRACNYGAKLASGDTFLFLNPDAIIEVGAASLMAKIGKSLSGPWIVGGLLVDKDGIEQRGSRRGELTFKTLFSGFNRHTDPLPNKPQVQPTVSGACMMMSRTGFDSISGFDPAYFLHVEDIDTCRRARMAGGDVYIAPQARVQHYGATSTASSGFVSWQKYKSFLRYFWTYKDGLGNKLLTIMLAPILAGRLLVTLLKG